MHRAIYNIMIIDDHPIIHDGLKTLLGSEKDLNISAVASSANQALKLLKNNLPDLAIIDLSLGDSDGTALIQKLKKKYPKLRTLVYTMSEEKLFAERTSRAGADGYVMKTSPPSELKRAIRTVLSGDYFFSPETTTRIQNKVNGHHNSPRSLIDKLSNRELDIFKLIGEGLDALSISERLNISRNTVDTHRINIKNKLELASGKAVDRFAYEVFQAGHLPN
ncbi:response regulator transcription factor [Pontiellaceae bacterium B12219]|nr:response regulator transcription factor [Pontiellaceae bacterium B12219]